MFTQTYLPYLFLLFIISGCFKNQNINHLGNEKSPYLLLHKDNPIWWFPWSDEAFIKAKKEKKLVFLSIGYSSCHWCHVMEKESFNNQEVATIINKNYVSIKVDREERPDVDFQYMEAIHAMGKRGGWPLNVFLTPEGTPIWGGTYYTKGQLINVLKKINTIWEKDQFKITERSKGVEDYFEHELKKLEVSSSLPFPPENYFRRTVRDIFKNYEPDYGGFNDSPKFPPHQKLRVAMRIIRRSDQQKEENKKLSSIVTKTLDQMYKGGMYDHIGGGFHRYSTDKKWLVPHFEKMLYSNANLVTTYLEAYQLFKNETYKLIAIDILDWVLKEMTSPQGGFYSAQDADTDGKEGDYYLWTFDELNSFLGKDITKLSKVYDIQRIGHYHKKNIFNLLKFNDIKASFDQPITELRHKLYQLRLKRPRPLTDDKIITSWNGLMIGAFALAYQITKLPRFLKAAQNSAQFIHDSLYTQNKELKRRYRLGEARFNGTLDDYAYLIQGLIYLYQADFDPNWIKWAMELQDLQDQNLWSEKHHIYFYTHTEEGPIKKTVSLFDNARPSSIGVSILNLFELYSLSYKNSYRDKGEFILKSLNRSMKRFPLGQASAMLALDWYYDYSKEVAIVGDADHKVTLKMKQILQDEFIPNKVIAFKQQDSQSKKNNIDLLENKMILDNLPTAYVCENKVCKRPTNDPQVLAKQIKTFKAIKL